MKAKLEGLEAITQIKQTTIGVPATSDPIGNDLITLHGREATMDTNTEPEMDAVDRQKTLASQTRDARETRFPLRSDDMSRLVATSTGQSSPQPHLIHSPETDTTNRQKTLASQTRDAREIRFPLHSVDMSKLVATPTGQSSSPCLTPVGHPGRDAVATAQQKHKVQAQERNTPTLKDTRAAEGNMTGPSCCDCGWRQQRLCLQAFCIAQDKQYGNHKPGAHTCEKVENLHVGTNRGNTNLGEEPPKSTGWNKDAVRHTQEPNPPSGSSMLSQ